ncbi:hypothetical protein EB796_017549 [Bugula neritina]|uniref:Uncharacterized protein n=1 Tax=Bugula neritina TaxID=10212 RepID=A0A7J7JEW5_BUGNE|nr:hypothetical protein EB796_017549 [Bugula neritina]
MSQSLTTTSTDLSNLVLPPSKPADDDSDLSDVEEQGYAFPSASDPVLALKLCPTQKAHIQCLFNNIDKVLLSKNWLK